MNSVEECWEVMYAARCCLEHNDPENAYKILDGALKEELMDENKNENVVAPPRSSIITTGTGSIALGADPEFVRRSEQAEKRRLERQIPFSYYRDYMGMNGFGIGDTSVTLIGMKKKPEKKVDCPEGIEPEDLMRLVDKYRIESKLIREKQERHDNMWYRRMGRWADCHTPELFTLGAICVFISLILLAVSSSMRWEEYKKEYNCLISEKGFLSTKWNCSPPANTENGDG